MPETLFDKETRAIMFIRKLGSARRSTVTATLTFALVGSALIGCGDDDPVDGSSGDAGESAGGEGGSGGDGGGGEGGDPAGGEGGSGGGAGSPGLAGSAGEGGSGGQGGSAGAPTFAPIVEVSDQVITGANDLRGLTFAADGKIYASGHSDAIEGNRQVVVARFTAEGELDATFAGDGIFEHDFAPGDEQSLGVVELENGDVIVQAQISDGKGGAAIPDDSGVAPGSRPNGQDVVLMRLDSSGELVASFGTGGIAKLDFGWTDADDASWPAPTYNSLPEPAFSHAGFPVDQSWGIALDSSGEEERIVVFGFGPAAAGQDRLDNDRYIARVMASDGSPDPTFNGGEVFTLNSGGTFSDNARRGIVLDDGSILSAGYANFGVGLDNHIMVIRLGPNGAPDTSFGFGIGMPGVARTNPFIDDGGMAECYALGVQSSGRIVTTGYGRATGPNMMSRLEWATTDEVDLVSFGLLDNGLDPDFGRSGTLAIQSEESALGNTQDRGRDLIVLPDDRAVHVGRFGPTPAIFVATADGQLDESVGDDGKFTYEPLTPPPDFSHFFAVALSPDGTRLAATTSNHADGVILAILEVETD